MVVGVIPRLAQWADLSQTWSGLAPLLELQAPQHGAMFSRVMILAPLMMCSHVATECRGIPRGTHEAITTPQ